MFFVYNKPEADRDLLEAAEWYEEQQKGLGGKFIDEVEELLGYLETNPLLFPIKYKEVRQAILTRFPYVILFRIESKTVIVLAVFNCYLNPAKKKKRTKKSR